MADEEKEKQEQAITIELILLISIGLLAGGLTMYFLSNQYLRDPFFATVGVFLVLLALSVVVLGWLLRLLRLRA